MNVFFSQPLSVAELIYFLFMHPCHPGMHTTINSLLLISSFELKILLCADMLRYRDSEIMSVCSSLVVVMVATPPRVRERAPAGFQFTAARGQPSFSHHTLSRSASRAGLAHMSSGTKLVRMWNS